MNLIAIYRKIYNVTAMKIQETILKLRDFLLIARTCPYVLLLSIVTAFSSFTQSYLTASISQAHELINHDIGHLDSNSLVVTGVIGALLGSSMGIFINDRIGRLWCLRTTISLFFLGILLMANTSLISTFLIGQFIFGLAFGISWVSHPLYLSEAYPHRILDTLISIDGLLSSIGQVTSTVIMDTFVKVPQEWRWMILLAGIPVVAQFWMTLMLVDSPFWLYRQGKIKEATAALRRSCLPSELGEQLRKLEAQVSVANSSEVSLGTKIKNAWTDVVSRRAIRTSALLVLIQEFGSLKYITFYKIKLHDNSSTSSRIRTVGDLVCVVFVGLAGRRFTLTVSMIGTTLCLISLSCICWWCNDCLKLLKATLFEVHNLFFYIGYDSLPRVISADVYGTSSRDLGATSTAIHHWLMNFLSTLAFRRLKKYDYCSTLKVLAIVSIFNFLIIRAFVLTRN